MNRPDFYSNFSKSDHADPKPSYDDMHYYAIHITSSQFLDRSCDAAASVTQRRNCKYAAIYHAISQKRY